MLGGLDPLYIAARRALLNALEALERQLEALVLVGAQAVYIYAGEADLAVAPYTTDGDVAIDPARLSPKPLLEDSLSQAGFALVEGAVGIWQAQVIVNGIRRPVQVDLLVPNSLGGSGRRGARIPPHSRRAARKAVGLEPALVDNDEHVIAAFEPDDKRSFRMQVAGPAALLVAKVHKIIDRETDRRSDKDALDTYRLLRAVETNSLAVRFATLLSNPLSEPVTSVAIKQLPVLFGRSNSPGTEMAVRAAAPLEDGEILAASLVALVDDLIRALPNSS
jgi:hypothetical protein